LLHLLGEVGVFRQEAIAGVHGDGIGHLHGADNGRDIEVALVGRVWSYADAFIGQAHMFEVHIHLGVDGNGADAQFLAGAQDAKGDFAAIGDQYFVEHGLSPLV